MAAGDSIVSICNLALGLIGERAVTSVSPPDNTARAILCNQFYDPVRRAVLRSHPWNCAKKQAAIPASATPPLFTWSFAYPQPSDFVRMFDEPDQDRPEWELMGNLILTNDGPPLNLVYIYDLMDPTRFDPLLIEALAHALATDIAVPLTQDRSKRADLAAITEGKLSIARLAGAQENAPKEWDEDIWLRSRR